MFISVGFDWSESKKEPDGTVDVWELSDRMELVMTHSAETVEPCQLFYCGRSRHTQPGVRSAL